jgi:hypothetical protein
MSPLTATELLVPEIVAARADFVFPERYERSVERDLRARSGARSAPNPLRP